MAEDWNATLAMITSLIGTIIGWIGGRVKNKIANKKGSAEASATLSDYYKKEIEYIAGRSEANLKKIEELEDITNKLIDQRCIVDCKERRPITTKTKIKILNDEINIEKSL